MASAKRSVWARFERLLEAIVDHVPHVVLVKDADLRLVLANRAAEELMGLPRSLMVGRTVHEHFSAEQAAAFTASDREALGAGGPIEILEEPFLSPTKGLRLLRTVKIPILGTDGRAQYLLGISVDMTAQLELEARLRHAQRLESLGRLTAGVAHDFRNLLTVISMCTTEALSALPPDHPVVSELRDIHSASARATALTQRMLAVGGRHVRAPTVIDLAMVATRLEPLLRRLVGDAVALELVDDQRAALVYADAGEMEQILMNLVTNARDAMPNGGRLTIEIGHCSSPASPEGDLVCLAVRDTGRGMDASTRARMFESFFTTKTPGEGTGLGLATVYAIVRDSGGKILVDSAPGLGTTFRILFPCVSADADGQPHAPVPDVSRPSHPGRD